MIRSVFGKERFLNEAKESDFAGKDTIVVVSVVGQKMVQKKEKEMRRRDDDGFADKSRNYGVEAYYLVDAATAAKLMSTCLFFSTVDPEEDQILYMLKGTEPVVVHRSAGTNFAYRNSNEFETNCINLKTVMQAVFGAKDVKVYNFKAGWNSGNNRSYRTGDALLTQWFGRWEAVTLGSSDMEVAKAETVNSAPHQSFRQYGQKLAAMKDKFVDRAADLESFLTMKSRPFSLSEQDASDLRSETMMTELQEGGWEQQEFDFNGAAEPAGSITPSEAEAEVELHKIGEEAAAKVGGLRYVRGNVDGDGTWSDGFLDDGRYVVDHQYGMVDPDDSDFYERHSPFLEEFAKRLPVGWKAEYTNWEDAPDSKMIGTKYIDSKEVDRTSGPWGAEEEITYSVVEELTLTRGAVAESDDLDLAGEPERRLDEAELDDDGLKAEFCAAFEKKFPDVDENDYEVLCYDEDGRKSLNLRVYDPGKARSSAFGRRVEAMMKDFGCVEIERADLPDEPDWATWLSFFERPAGDGEDGDSIRVDFPAWALDYWVNTEIGSVSRQERDQIEAWKRTMDLNGYDVNMIDFGEEEFFSSSPEFGLPCDCVEAVVSLKK